MGDRPDYEQSLNIFDLIDSICAEFRQQWKDGKRPVLFDYLDRVPEAAQAHLFKNLLPIELRYIRRSGTNPDSQQYLIDFPALQNVIREIFDESVSRIATDENAPAEDDRSSLHADQFPVTVDVPAANRIGEYELVRELGRGGFGVVYEAKHVKRGHRVALKTLPTGIDGQQVNTERLLRFRREFRSLAEVNHPNLVGMQSLEVDGAQWFFTMDLVEGRSFLEYVRPAGELNERRLRSSLPQLISGIVALHERGIVHRDLKPANILVSDNGAVTILDFGLVAQLQTAADATVSRSGMFVGTPRYAAPEQLFGERTEASDWYALGVMIFEALTGAPPFSGEGQMALLQQKQQHDPPSLNELPEVPSDLAEIGDGLLKRQAEKRWSTTELLERFQLESETRSSSTATAGDSIDLDQDFASIDGRRVRLVGRESQMAQLEEARQELVESKRPIAVWVNGLSGEGKTSLCEEFLRSMHAQDNLLILRGRCYDRESVPFKAIDSQIDSLVRFLKARSDAELGQLLPNGIAILAELFPLLRRVDAIGQLGHLKTAGIDEQQSRELAVTAFQELIASVSQRHPIVMFIDDLQWGDADSADVLFRTLSSERLTSVLLIGTFRTDEMNNSAFLREWSSPNRQSEIEKINHKQIEVNPLSPEECLDYVCERFDTTRQSIRKHLANLFEETKGNPYFLEQLVEGYDSTTGEFRPITLSEVIDRRLKRCPKDATKLLEMVAIAGKAVSAAEITSVLGGSQTPVSTLTHMRSEGLVRIIGGKDDMLVDTYHDKIRETCLGLLSNSERQSRHLQYAETLELEARKNKRSDDEYVFDLAWHFLEAEDPRAFLYQLQAARAALNSYAMENALEHLHVAIRLQPTDLDMATRYDLLIMSGSAAMGCNILQDALDHFREASRIAPSHLDKAISLSSIAYVYLKIGDHPQAKRYFEEALLQLGEKQPATLLTKLWRIFTCEVALHLVPNWARRFKRLAKHPDEVHQICSIYQSYWVVLGSLDHIAWLYSVVRCAVVSLYSEEDSVRAMAMANYGWQRAFVGLRFLGKGCFRRGLERHRSGKDADSRFLQAMTAQSIGTWYLFCGDLNQSAKYLRESLASLSTIRNWYYSLTCHWLRHIASAQGNSVETVSYAAQEWEYGRTSKDPVLQSWGEYGLIDGYSRMGKVDLAMQFANSSEKVLRSLGNFTISICLQEKGRACLQASDYESATAAFEEGIRLNFRNISFCEVTLGHYGLLAESLAGAHWAQAKSSVAYATKRRASRAARRARLLGRIWPTLRPNALRASGRVAFVRGSIGKARRYFDKAIAVSSKIGMEYERARALVDKSMLKLPNATADREEGLKSLENLGCVLPISELEYLRVDQATHYSSAKSARDRYVEEHEIPEFDLAAWESEQDSTGESE